MGAEEYLGPSSALARCARMSVASRSRRAGWLGSGAYVSRLTPGPLCGEQFNPPMVFVLAIHDPWWVSMDG